ncbi:MAG: imidazole glycerol phosphate synthase subunit HisH [Bacteroidetes bacterium]|jgi:glutamine amidotransferase|nr:imidazole glycerol phosphate synthase subunit HisH [Bacteroidota bacterium]
MVTIIDYGIGNLRSIEKAFEAVGVDVLRTDDATAIAEAERLVLPGVGAFGACIGEIRRRGLEAPIHEAVDRGVPFLGVCVGLQLLFDESTERGTHRGLGLLPGRVVRFSFEHLNDQPDPHDPQPKTRNPKPATQNPQPKTRNPKLKIPHMGWNTLVPHRASPLLEGLDDGAFVYFVHSYHAVAERPDDVLAHTTYGVDFPAVVSRNNVFGVQFHPEKSQHAGLRILQNFAQL